MPILGVIASSYLQSVDFGAVFPIATITVPSTPAASVTFSSIPQTYTHLQIRGNGRVNRAGFAQNGCRFRFNGDSGNNYSFHQLYGNGATAGSEGYASQPEMNLGELPSANAPANVFGIVMIDILDYTNTNKYKTTFEIGANERNNAGQIGVNSGAWYNTNAVTSITLFEAASSWVQYSSFTLYGIK
jgi:hypothetical protein